MRVLEYFRPPLILEPSLLELYPLLTWTVRKKFENFIRTFVPWREQRFRSEIGLKLKPIFVV